MDIWTVYSDGGCLNNPGPCAYGCVMIAPDKTSREISGFIGQGTNQIAEITAAIRGLEQTPARARVVLVSDSEYTLKGLTEWRRGWERRGWRNAKGDPVANLALWKELFAVADARNVTTRWVKGHSGNPFNERCDELASIVLESQRQDSRPRQLSRA